MVSLWPSNQTPLDYFSATLSGTHVLANTRDRHRILLLRLHRPNLHRPSDGCDSQASWCGIDFLLQQLDIASAVSDFPSSVCPIIFSPQPYGPIGLFLLQICFFRL